MEEKEKKDQEAQNQDSIQSASSQPTSSQENSLKDEEGLTLEDYKKRAEEYLDGWKRAKADLINYKKEEAKRFEALAKFANERIIRDLLTVLDSFDLAILAFESQIYSEKEDKLTEAEKSKLISNLKGVYLIRAQLEDVLKNYGLERLSVSLGQKFDPLVHEAVATVESDQPSGTIVEEVEKGYLLHGKLIRPARVKVAK